MRLAHDQFSYFLIDSIGAKECGRRNPEDSQFSSVVGTGRSVLPCETSLMLPGVSTTVGDSDLIILVERLKPIIT